MLGQNSQGIGKKSVMKTLGQDDKAEEGGGSMGASLWRLAHCFPKASTVGNSY